jgi:hypothetical protein
MQKEQVWKEVQEFYKIKFGYEASLLDAFIDYDILKMCVGGASTQTICKFLGIQEDKVYTPVTNAIDRHFGFQGWNTDLEFSPINVYRNLETKDEESFADYVTIHYGNLMNVDIHNMYKACVVFIELEKLLNEKWV